MEIAVYVNQAKHFPENTRFPKISCYTLDKSGKKNCIRGLNESLNKFVEIGDSL